MVHVIEPNGSIMSTANNGVVDAADSDAGTNGFTGCYELSSGEKETNVDAAL